MSSGNNGMGQILLFRLGEDAFGLEVTLLQEVVDHPSLHYLPRAPEHFLGAINVHGQVLPVLDLAGHLGYPAGRRSERYLVLAPGICALALAVDSVGRIVTPDEPEEDGAASSSAVAGEGEVLCGGIGIRLLDVEQLRASLERIFYGTGGQHGI